MESELTQSYRRNYFWARFTTAVFLIGVLSIVNFPSSPWVIELTHNYLPIHMVLEFMGILVSFAIFTVGWATYKNVRSADILVLSVISFAVGWLDFGHTLSFTGMPDFVTPSGPNKAIDFWLVSRLTGGLGFLFVAMAPPREFIYGRVRSLMLATMIVWSAFWFWTILLHEQSLPTMFVHGQGLSQLKIYLEWITVGLSIAAGLMFFRQAVRRNIVSFHWIGCASFIFAMSGFFFTLYRDFDDLYNFAGHVYKAIGFLLVYRAVVVECISRPYNEARRLAREASEASLSKSRFLANVSHEFRTPLAVITGFSDMLLESPSLDQRARQWSETIARNSRQLGLLIDDLLDLAKVENERINVRWSSFHPAQVIEDVVNSLTLQAEKKSLRLFFKSEVPYEKAITSDKLRFRQILLNLIGNAIKFSPRGEVRVFLRSPEPDFIEVTIQDTGIGIEAGQAERLFHPFAQADDPNRRRFGGTGLGLALSKKLAGLLGGQLWLAQSLPDKGSTFVFTIAHQPNAVVETNKDDFAYKPGASAQANFQGLRILAAEDSIDNQNLLIFYMQPTDAKITFANNGIEALDLAKKNEYDLILMDIQMPEMDGFEAVTRLRDHGWKGPILALSAHAHQTERDRAMRGGFNDYLVKPISKEKLWDAISFYARELKS